MTLDILPSPFRNAVSPLSSFSQEEDFLAWICLSRTFEAHLPLFYKLLHYYKTPLEVLRKVPSLMRLGRVPSLPFYSFKASEEEIKKAHALNAHLVPLGSPLYPQKLSKIDPPPPLLTILGNKDLLNYPALSIVGAHDASLQGKHFSEHLAQDLTKGGFLISGGFSKGIEFCAHRGALENGTLVILAGGLDASFPSEDTPFFSKILDFGGVFISEMPFGFLPKKQHFLKRARLISGIAKGVIFIEATRLSYAKITADFALEQGRDIFAVPGFPLDRRSHGTNTLIKQGALLVTKAQDILETYHFKEG